MSHIVLAVFYALSKIIPVKVFFLTNQLPVRKLERISVLAFFDM